MSLASLESCPTGEPKDTFSHDDARRPQCFIYLVILSWFIVASKTSADQTAGMDRLVFAFAVNMHQAIFSTLEANNTGTGQIRRMLSLTCAFDIYT